MPVQTEARDEALRCAQEAARIVLAKHPCVTGTGSRCSETRTGPLDFGVNCDRVLALYERQDVGRGQDVAGADGSI